MLPGTAPPSNLRTQTPQCGDPRLEPGELGADIGGRRFAILGVVQQRPGHGLGDDEHTGHAMIEPLAIVGDAIPNPEMPLATRSSDRRLKKRHRGRG
jgi:hypothetical protein